MRVLALEYNILDGPLPLAWQRMSQLEVLLLDHNQLSGTLPPAFLCPPHLPSLMQFDVSFNNLQGTLPGACGIEECRAPPEHDDDVTSPLQSL